MAILAKTENLSILCCMCCTVCGYCDTDLCYCTNKENQKIMYTYTCSVCQILFCGNCNKDYYEDELRNLIFCPKDWIDELYRQIDEVKKEIKESK